MEKIDSSKNSKFNQMNVFYDADLAVDVSIFDPVQNQSLTFQIKVHYLYFIMYRILKVFHSSGRIATAFRKNLTFLVLMNRTFNDFDLIKNGSKYSSLLGCIISIPPLFQKLNWIPFMKMNDWFLVLGPKEKK